MDIFQGGLVWTFDRKCFELDSKIDTALIDEKAMANWVIINDFICCR